MISETCNASDLIQIPLSVADALMDVWCQHECGVQVYCQSPWIDMDENNQEASCLLLSPNHFLYHFKSREDGDVISLGSPDECMEFAPTVYHADIIETYDGELILSLDVDDGPMVFDIAREGGAYQ